MTFYPTIVTTSSYANSAANTHAVPLPASRFANNLLLISFASPKTISLPAGWTSIASQSTTNIKLLTIAKTVVGNEAANVSITLSANGAGSAVLYNIGNWNGNIASFVVAIGSGNNLNPNSPATSIDSTLGYLLILPIATITNGPVTAYPTGWNIKQLSSFSVSCGTAICANQSPDLGSDLTVDPPSYTLTASGNWLSATIGIVFGNFGAVPLGRNFGYILS